MDEEFEETLRALGCMRSNFILLDNENEASE